MLKAAKNISIGVGVVAVATASAYFLAKPVILEKSEPVLQEMAKKYINGTLTWDTLDLDKTLDIKLNNVQLKDSENQDVLKSSHLRVGWSFSSLYNAFIKGEGATAIIDNITIEKPELTIRQKTDNSWNVQNLIIPQKEKTSSNFNIKINIIDGAFMLKQNNKENQQLKNINGVINLQKDFKLDGKISAIYENANVKFAWKYIDNKDITLTLSGGKLPLKQTLDTLIENNIPIPKLPIDNGLATIKAANIIKNKDTWSYSIKGDVEEVVAKYKNYNISNLNAKVDITNGTAILEDIKGKINDQSVFGYFKINWSGKETEIQSKMSTKGAELYAIAPDFGMHGKLSGNVKLGGTLKNIQAIGKVNIDEFNNDKFRVKKVISDFNFKDNVLDLKSLEVISNSGKSFGNVSYNLNTSEFNADMILNSIKAEDILKTQELRGEFTGNLNISGKYLNSISLNSADVVGTVHNFGYSDIYSSNLDLNISLRDDELNANVVANEASVKGIKFDTFDANVSKKGNNIVFNNVSGFYDGGSAVIKGNIKDNENNLSVSLYNWNVSTLSELAGHKLSGRATSEIKVKGDLLNPYIIGNVDVYDGFVDNIDFKHSYGKFHIDKEALDIDSLNVERNEDSHVISGKIYRDDKNTLDLTMKSSNARIEKVLSVFNLDYPLTGNVDNEIYIRGTFNNPKIEGHLHAWDGSLKGQLFENIYGNYRYDNGKLYIKNGQVNAYGGVTSLEGNVSNDLIDINVNAVDVDLERIIPERGIVGKIGVKGHLSGKISSPEFDGIISSRSVNIGNSSLGLVSADFKYKNNVFLISNGNFYQGNANFKVKGRYNLETSVINGSLNYNNWNLADIIKVFKLPVQNVDGNVDGYIGLSGSVYDSDIEFKANINGGHLGNTEIGKGNVDITYFNKELNIRKFSIPIGEGLLAAKGSMSADGNFDMQFAARNMDVNWIPQVTGLDATVGGNLTAALVLNGTRKDPKMNVSIGIENPNYNNYKFDEISLMGIIKDNIIDVQNVLIKRDKYKASMKGTAPLGLITRTHSSNEVPIDLKLNLDNADMNALALFFTPIQKADGPLKGQLKIAGTWEDPQIFGDIHTSNGSMTLITMNEPLSSVNLSAKFKGKSIDLDSTAAIGSGNLSIKGSAVWNKNSSLKYNGELHLHAPKIKSEFYNGAIDADFEFEPFEGIPSIIGNVNIHDANLDIPLMLQSDGKLPEMFTDVDIKVGNNVRLYNSALYNMEILGDIRANGFLTEPFMSGRINVEKGTIKVNTTEFKVEKGQAVWGGNSESFMPNVHVISNANVGSYKIGAEISGTPGNLITKLHSEPYLNDSQILMLLTLHQNPHAGPEDSTQNAFFNAGLAMIFNGGVKDFLTDKIGLDMISVTSGLSDYYDSNSIDKNNFYYIKIGKYLFNDFMLTATSGINNEEKSVGFRYDVNSHLGISAWYNSNHDSFVGTDWKFRF